ncbi:MAG TPA: SusC/RagA family TonB-linked outer membrane protein [Puia sp.]|nr:SusC/RagA family TonB-linked outer membrane protein [Puia sp.]
MKLTFVMMLAGILQVSAHADGQAKVSLNLNHVEIAKALRSIENQGDYRFLYNNNLKSLSQRIDISVNAVSIREALDRIFAGTDLSYKVLDNNLIVVLSSALTYQDIRITGKITGDNGEALSGVTITLKGTSVGTTTDNNGNFTLVVPQTGTLAISYIGYESQEVKVNNQSVINVTMTASKKALDEVVVIGYGTASKRDLTGSIVKIDASEVNTKPNPNPLSSLQAQVPGVSVVNSGVPGEAPDVRITGTISLGNTHPLYVVDGILESDINFINPSDIESMEVLKDPSSLAIYGEKGAGGVIIVTTKTAKQGKLIVSLNSTYGAKQMVDEIPMANGPQFKQILTQEAANRLFDNGNTVLSNFAANELQYWNGNTDWLKTISRTAQYSNTSVSVSSATDKNKFYSSIGYTTDQGLVQGTQYDKITLNIADELKVSKNVRFGFNLNGTKEDLPYDAAGGGVLSNAMQLSPIVPSGTQKVFTHDPYGGPTDSGNFNLYYTVPTIQNTLGNPLETVKLNSNKVIDPRYRVVGSVYVDVNFLKYFDFRATEYLDYSDEEKRQYTPIYQEYNPDPNSGAAVGAIFNGHNLTSLTQTNYNNINTQQDYILSFKKQFGDHSVNLNGGFTFTYNKNEYTTATLRQDAGQQPIPNNPRLWYLSTGFGDPTRTIASGNQWDGAQVGSLVRLLYNYAGKYYVTGTFRRDYSSAISTAYANQGQDFWSVGAAWEITKEKFLENQSLFDYIKIKGSTGVLGNANIFVNNSAIPYPAYPGILAGNSGVFGTNTVSAYTDAYLANPNLHWETVHASEAGFEFSAFKNRLHFEADYYNKKTEGLLVELGGNGNGLSQITLTNDGNITNQGFEFSGTWLQVFSKDLSLTLGGNLTTFSNKVTYLAQLLGGDPQLPSTAITGQPIGFFTGYVVAGLYQSYADILHSTPSAVNGQSVAPGDFKYADIKHVGVIDSRDQTNIGNPTPKFQYGGNFDLRYRRWNLSGLVGGVYGNRIYREWGTSLQQNSLYNYPAYDVNAWHGPGTSNWIPIVDAQHLNNRAPSTYGIEDGSYVRIRNLELGYSIPAKALGNSHIQGLRFFVGVQNLKTWKHNLGFSPEFGGFRQYDPSGRVVNGGNSAWQFGVDTGDPSSILPRIWSGGFNVNF